LFLSVERAFDRANRERLAKAPRKGSVTYLGKDRQAAAKITLDGTGSVLVVFRVDWVESSEEARALRWTETISVANPGANADARFFVYSEWTQEEDVDEMQLAREIDYLLNILLRKPRRLSPVQEDVRRALEKTSSAEGRDE
jgi:hypothetical protein